MTMRYAVATGNWSATTTWNGGTLPAVGDDVYANNKTVTVDQNISVRSLSNIAVSPAAVGGLFATSGTRTITLYELRVGNYTGFGAPGRLLQIPGGTVTVNVSTLITGDINTQYIHCYALEISGAATVTLNVPSIIGGIKESASAVMVSGNGVTLNLTGNVLGGNGQSALGVDVSGDNAVVTAHGDVTGGPWQDSQGIRLDSIGGQLTVHGDVSGGTMFGAFGIYVPTGVVRVDGTMHWGAGGCAPVSGGQDGRLMFMRGAETRFSAPSDDNWPADSGATITVGSLPFPADGIIWPPSSLNPTP